jgi:hypothetical protein
MCLGEIGDQVKKKDVDDLSVGRVGEGSLPGEINKEKCVVAYPTSEQKLSRLGEVLLQSYLETFVDSRNFIHANRQIIC